MNLAARLEGANKAFGTGIPAFAGHGRTTPLALALRPLDDVIVKGKTAPVRVLRPAPTPRCATMHRLP